MTVRELIAELSTRNQDAPVLLWLPDPEDLDSMSSVIKGRASIVCQTSTGNVVIRGI